MKKTIVVLCPHTDDGEFGCGGAISRFLREGNRVVFVVFSICQGSVPEGEKEDVLKIEFNKAMDYYNIPTRDRVIYNYPVRHFPQYRQSILDDMIEINKVFSPDMVFMPSMHDIHQDHHVVASEAMRAFKKTTLLGYEEPWNNFTFNNQAYIDLEQEDIANKIAAVSCYDTQKGRDYASEEFIRGVARTHGVQIGKKYAEVFEVMRWIM